MKKLFLPFIAIMLLVFFSSCGVSGALVLNHNQNSTQVHLTSNNYKVVGNASGSSDVAYVFIFGGMNRKQLYKNAYSEMVHSADLVSGSKALINILTEEHVGGVPPFYYKRTITVSANVIEFIK